MTALPDFWTFICTDCAAEGHSPTRATPFGWDFVEGDADHPATVRCPDCAEMVEQQHFARHAATAPVHVGIDTARAPDRAALCLLARTDTGYRVVLIDHGIDRTPLGLELPPATARAIGSELIQLADLAERPGTSLGEAAR